MVHPMDRHPELSPQLGEGEPAMRQRLETRLRALKAEFATGQQHLAGLEEDMRRLRETLLRISGAIQVLEEMLAEPAPPGTA